MILERDGKFYPIEIKCKTNPTKSDLSGLTAFRATYSHLSIETGLVIHGGSEVYFLDKHTIALPWNYVQKPIFKS